MESHKQTAKIKSMKSITFTFLIFFLALAVSAQSTVHTIQHGGLTRSYRLYVPSSYNANTAVPLVFNLHGYTSNAQQQEVYGDFRGIADTANFILVHPDGTLDGSGARFWNAFGAAGGVDDVGFISALIDKINEDYNIDLNRVYSCGMSNGGFMSYRLACELGDRITAVASVTGTMAINAPAACNPYKPTPIMQIHGTADPTVPYNGNATMTAIETVVDFWVDQNNCNSTPIFTAVPNTNTTDMCTAEHYLYTNGSNGSTVEFFKIIGGGHTWPNAPITIGVTNRDIDASIEIWRFFSQFNTNGLLSNPTFEEALSFQIYPNPARDLINIRTNKIVERIHISDLSGKNILALEGQTESINISALQSGVYFITLYSFGEVWTEKFVVE